MWITLHVCAIRPRSSLTCLSLLAWRALFAKSPMYRTVIVSLRTHNVPIIDRQICTRGQELFLLHLLRGVVRGAKAVKPVNI